MVSIGHTPRENPKIHIFPKDPIMRMGYNTSPSHTLEFLKKYIITIPDIECGKINSRILKDTSNDKITRISSEPTRRILHTRYSSSITCNRG